MKALSLWQPWASLIAVGAKTMETRGWSTTYRGPLLIHAAKRTPDTLTPLAPIFTALEAADVDPRAVLDWNGQRWVERCIDSPRTWGRPMPLGAVVATCTLADVVPMVQFLSRGPGHSPTPPWLPATAEVPMPLLAINSDGSRLTVHHGAGTGQTTDVTDQVGHGDFTPGRYAWLLDNVQALPEAIPAKGRQGLWTPDADLIAAIEAGR